MGTQRRVAASTGQPKMNNTPGYTKDELTRPHNVWRKKRRTLLRQHKAAQAVKKRLALAAIKIEEQQLLKNDYGGPADKKEQAKIRERMAAKRRQVRESLETRREIDLNKLNNVIAHELRLADCALLGKVSTMLTDQGLFSIAERDALFKFYRGNIPT